MALTTEGLLAVETKNYSGAIFGTARDAKLSQKLGGRSYRFQNPIHQNYLHVSALQALQLGIPVQGQVVFTDKSRFPKGMPAGVSFLSHLQQDPTGTGVPRAYLAAWEKLKQIARTDGAARREHLASIREKHGGGVRWIAWAMFAASGVWMAVLWSWSGSPLSLVQPTIAKREHQVPATVQPSVTTTNPNSGGHTAVPADETQEGRPAPVAEITWSTEESSRRSECNLSTAAVLIEDSAENRRKRKRACDVDRLAPM